MNNRLGAGSGNDAESSGFSSPPEISDSQENLSHECHYSWCNMMKTGQEAYVPSGHSILKLLETLSALQHVHTSDFKVQKWNHV